VSSTRYHDPKDIDYDAAGVLQPHLQWHDRGPKCTVTTLLQVMFYAAARAIKPWLMAFGAWHRKARNGSSKSTGIASASRPATAHSVRLVSRLPPVILRCACCLAALRCCCAAPGHDWPSTTLFGRA
jgi:hypothetical protein